MAKLRRQKFVRLEDRSRRDVFKPLIISDLRKIIEGEDHFRDLWIAGRRGFKPPGQAVPLYLVVQRLLKGCRLISLTKRTEVIQEMELEALAEFMNFTKCLIKDYSETTFWRNLYLWAYRESYPACKKDRNAIAIPEELLKCVYRLAPVFQELMVHVSKAAYEVRHRTVMFIAQKYHSLLERYPNRHENKARTLHSGEVRESFFQEFENSLGPVPIIDRHSRELNLQQNRLARSLQAARCSQRRLTTPPSRRLLRQPSFPCDEVNP